MRQNRNLKFLNVILLILLFSACNNDDLNQFKDQPYKKTGKKTKVIQAEYRQGRLAFKSKPDFTNTIRRLKQLQESEKSSAFKVFYEQGFIPAYPYYDNPEGSKMKLFLQEKKKYIPRKYQNKELEKEDLLISSNIFASLLNNKREIIVGDKLYKYTYSGLLSTDIKNEKHLKKYVAENDLYNKVPNPKTLPPGDTEVENGLGLYVNPDATNPDNNDPPCGVETGTNDNLRYPSSDNPLNQVFDNDFPCGYDGTQDLSPGAGDKDHTESLINYINNISPCNVGEQFNPFGVTKVCKEYFPGGKRRTKTIYANENYGIYKDVRIKTLHQRHHNVWFVKWWAGKKASEAALLIKDICLKITPPKMEIPNPNFNVPPDAPTHMVFYGDGKLLDGTPGATNYSYNIPSSKYPQTPFDEDVIVEFYNNNIPWGELTNQKVSKLFWDQVYNQVKSISHTALSKEPKKITMLMVQPEGTYVLFTNLTKRKLHTKKIKDILAYDWGIKVSFNLPLDGNNNVITNPSNILDLSNTKVQAGDLADFETVRFNISGVTRVNDTWKGSNMVYGAD